MTSCLCYYMLWNWEELLKFSAQEGRRHEACPAIREAVVILLCGKTEMFLWAHFL